MTFRLALLVCLPILFFAVPSAAQNTPTEPTNPTIEGALRQWHKVTLTIDGPEAAEDGTPNPFLDFRMQVTFVHPASGLSYVVPGYFAADGDAANTSATSGNKWRAHLSPDHIGQWNYRISFRRGPRVAVSDNPGAGAALPSIDGLAGTFNILPSDKTGRDFRGKGRLKYVGKHHLKFAGSGEFFLKAGVDAPENLLSYRDFDGDFKSDGHKDKLVKNWQPHVQDWKSGDPSWQDGKGKGLIGAINYVASEGLNSFSFLTLNIEGDDQNVFPYTTYDERERLDCSRLDQWEIVFSHGDKLGMYLHFKTQEAENVNLLDDGETGVQRQLYYRELIARFGHHLALNWNLGEEVGLGNEVSTAKKVAWADYFWNHDPYRHHIVIHNGNRHYDLLGVASKLTGFSLQTNQPDFRNVHNETKNYIRRSIKAGKPWVVACDEPGDASHSLVPDAEDPTRDNARQNALWGNLMAGGAGVEWYFGYKHDHSDLTCQDFRVRQSMWKFCRIALEFFENNKIPFQDMANSDDLLNTKNGYCLSQAGILYLVFLKQNEQVTLDLAKAQGVYEILWFDPRNGGELLNGSVHAVTAGGKVNLGHPPTATDRDWLAIVRPGVPNRVYPPGVSAGVNRTLMLPKNSDSITLDLNGIVSPSPTNAKNDEQAIQTTWVKSEGPGEVTFTNNAPATQATIRGAGTYILGLRAEDGSQSTMSSIRVTVEPFTARVARVITATDAAYVEGKQGFGNQHLKVEGNQRTAYIKFDVTGLPEKIIDAQLQLTEFGDTGSGTLRVLKGVHSNWSQASKKKSGFPYPEGELGKQAVQVGKNEAAAIPIRPMFQNENIVTLILKLQPGGNDIWFGSSRSKHPPKLIFTFEDPDGKYKSFGMPVGSHRKNHEDGKSKAELQSSVVLDAIKDFASTPSNDFVVSYKDKARRAMAIDASKFQDRYSAAETEYSGKSGKYDLVLTTLAETDGESSYRLLVGGKKIGEVQNPPTTQDYKPIDHRFSDVTLKSGDKIRVEFNSASNGKIPEGDAFAFARGRWRSVVILKPGTKWNTNPKKKKSNKPAAGTTTPFKFDYDPSKAKKVHQMTDSVLVVEAENYDAVDREFHRRWYLTTKEKSPGIKPDPDPNHATGAGGEAYLEILPDTRVTHADPLVNGVSFSNKPGECSVLYYPVQIEKAGRYFVWVRMCCTGSEDNGLHVGLDGTWPASGARLQFTGKHGK